jgi:Lrp/AsnC family transcriptional regulator
MVEITSLDRPDRVILDCLQRDASMPVAEIAEAAGLSPSPCWRRIRRLREDGIIKAGVTLLDREKLGLDFVVYASVKLALPSRDNIETFENLIRSWPEVTLCEMITGGSDYLIRVVTADMHAYDDFLREKLLALELVSDVQSRIVLSTKKDTTYLQVPGGD